MATAPANDGPRMARVLALQPRMTVDCLAEPVMSNQDPALLNVMTNLVRVWAWGRRTLPADFAETVTVTEVSRQPVVYASVDLERCSRASQEIILPLRPDRPVNTKAWPTDDLFALLPTSPPTFAASPATDRRRIPGNEEAGRCARCEGAGASRCRNCSGGKMACPSCGGALQIACSRCGGSGTHLGVSGRMIQCRNCNTRGTVQCTRCAQEGTIPCAVCDGEGSIACPPCGGHGNVVRAWELVETRRTDHRHRESMAEPWRGDWPAGFDQSPVVIERVYLTSGDPPVIELDTLAPSGPQQHLSALLQEALAAYAADRRNGVTADRVVAARVRLSGMYAYDVSLRYHGQAYGVLVAGGGTMVVPGRLPIARRGPIVWLVRLLKRYLRALQTDEVAGPQKAFIQAVRSGQAHIGDEACLIPEAAARIWATFEVTEAGYRCYVRDHPPGDISLAVGLDVRFDLDEHDQRMVCVDVDLGEAHRDRYVGLLALCHNLPAGRLAVVDGPSGTERINLVDRRPYDTSDAGQYAGVLRLMAAAARRLRGAEATD